MPATTTPPDSEAVTQALGFDPLQPMTFQEHREQTAADCEQIATMLTELAAQVREGNLGAFERWWMEGGTEEGDSKLASIRERIILRYLVREERVEKSIPKTAN